jgi:DNA-directed RNA polymerase specialized sigma24 family protein
LDQRALDLASAKNRGDAANLQQGILMICTSLVYDQEIDERLCRVATGVIARARASLNSAFEDGDLLQEIRFRAWKYLDTFDPTRGVLEAFFTTIAKNTVTDFLRSKKSTRKDFAWEEQIDAVDTLNARDIGDAYSPESVTHEWQVRVLLRRAKRATLDALTGSVRAIYERVLTPDESYIRFLADKALCPTSPQAVCGFFGISRNLYNQTFRKVYGEMTRILDTPEYIALTEQARECHRWPTIHVSRAREDHKFVGEVREARGLLSEPCGTTRERGSAGSRCVVTHNWGRVLYLETGGKRPSAATMVIEGEFRDNRCGTVVYGNFWKTVADEFCGYPALVAGLR